ncbi:MAG: hypothetical protein O9318_14640 [Hylemonella sp.]|uniref:hypothetical protein n=1 Tax=Hylemonella sp. TaxID=2066020 RepID=UPI0022CBAA4D|nr:hypothetical protein [Hylemonella sp.]MCZ8253704.1 hypothetical protein [Hylemonella sp.]
MRPVLLCLVLLLTAGAAWAGLGSLPRLPLRELVGLASFGALGGMLYWHLRK